MLIDMEGPLTISSETQAIILHNRIRKELYEYMQAEVHMDDIEISLIETEKDESYGSEFVARISTPFFTEVGHVEYDVEGSSISCDMLILNAEETYDAVTADILRQEALADLVDFDFEDQD